MGYSAKIILDSVNPVGDRLTTFEVTYPRMVHSEFLTHRMLCLAGDAELEFDLPTGGRHGYRRIHKVPIAHFVDRWLNGAARYKAKPKKVSDLGWIDEDSSYTPKEIATQLGFKSHQNINTLCRTGQIDAIKIGHTWHVSGQVVRSWRVQSPEHTRFNIQDRLSNMWIRQLNEQTNQLQTSHVVDACFSGVKSVYEVIAGNYKIAGSEDHLILTSTRGWQRIRELQHSDHLVVRRFGKNPDDRLDPRRFTQPNGRWRAVWQRQMRRELQKQDGLCRHCHQRLGVDIHHLIPVHQAPDRTFDHMNILLVCEACHQDLHTTQDWQGGTYLYGGTAQITSIRFRGIEPTYDLEIAGDYPNFIANGVVVHNSRNSASSRAIPNEKLRARVQNDPVLPVYWGLNGSGMQAKGELEQAVQAQAQDAWLEARNQMLRLSQSLADLGVHKQLCNRLLEPWMFITVIVTATDWENFFHLRCHKDAQPEIQKIAYMMYELYRTNQPVCLQVGEWHTPYIHDEDWTAILNPEDRKKVSVGRCARVSYLTHDGIRNPQADVELHDRLMTSGHWSCFEHQARALSSHDRIGNLRGWYMYRKQFTTEDWDEVLRAEGGHRHAN